MVWSPIAWKSMDFTWEHFALGDRAFYLHAYVRLMHIWIIYIM